MRLLDQVFGQSWAGGQSSDGNQRVNPALQQKLEQAKLRYVLDEAISRQCFELIRSDSGLLHPDNPMLRLPTGAFWLEWFSETVPGEIAHRLGALVEGSSDGRSGRIASFWAARGSAAGESSVAIHFDLDDPMCPKCPGVSVRHSSFRHLNSLFARMRCAPASSSSVSGSCWPGVQEEAEGIWFYLPLVLSFSVLLNSAGAVDERPSDLGRLNCIRIKRGRPPLLDHVEVRLRLGDVERQDRLGGGGARGMPRLHLVRGHVVSRRGATFWRSSHMRGDPTRAVASTTVRVTK